MSEPVSMAVLVEEAHETERRRDWPGAVRSWEAVRSGFSEDVVGHLRLGVALREMRRFDEADAILTPALEQFPTDAAITVEYARVAHVRADWPEALRRWELVRGKHPANADGVSGAGAALTHLGRLEEAEALLSAELDRFPGNVNIAVEFARVAHRRSHWPEALRRWNLVQERFPNNAEGHAGAGSAMGQLGRLDEAEAVLEAATGRFPKHSNLLIEYSRIAHLRCDWPEALRRWQIVRDSFPGHPEGYLGATTALRALNRLDDWNAVASEGVKRLPHNAALAVEFAEAAHSRQDWPEAIRRWKYARAHFPENPTIFAGLGRSTFSSRLNILDQGEPSEPHVRVAPRVFEADYSPEELLMRFEGLGSGCEFGLVQRHYGAEPPGLLRWGVIPPLSLANALNAKFAELGDPEKVQLYEFGDSKEFFFRDTRYNMEMHTFVPARSENYGQVLAQQCRRAKYLKRKLLEDLEAGEEIFVYKRHVGVLSDDEVNPIYQALRRYGRNTLLCVFPEQLPGLPNGTVEARAEGLMYAYVDALSQTSFAPEIKYRSWLGVLRTAHDLWRSGFPDHGRAVASCKLDRAEMGLVNGDIS
jgi:tetratricopeptide (TPR) repeat protein